jgi:hypothetical protein
MEDVEVRSSSSPITEAQNSHDIPSAFTGTIIIVVPAMSTEE